MSVPIARIIDAHHHLWDLGLNYYPWLSDRVGPRIYGDYAAIRRNYLREDFEADIGGLPVVASVHVQAEHDHTDPVRETRWLQSVADAPGSGGFPQAIVAFADLSGPPAPGTGAPSGGCRAGCVTGHAPPAGPRPVPAMGLPTDYLADAQWRSNVGLLARHRLSFDLQILPPHAPGRTAAPDAARRAGPPLRPAAPGSADRRTVDGGRAARRWRATARRRGSRWAGPWPAPGTGAPSGGCRAGCAIAHVPPIARRPPAANRSGPVSYTHLTLPTTERV